MIQRPFEPGESYEGLRQQAKQLSASLAPMIAKAKQLQNVTERGACASSASRECNALSLARPTALMRTLCVEASCGIITFAQRHSARQAPKYAVPVASTNASIGFEGEALALAPKYQQNTQQTSSPAKKIQTKEPEMVRDDLHGWRNGTTGTVAMEPSGASPSVARVQVAAPVKTRTGLTFAVSSNSRAPSRSPPRKRAPTAAGPGWYNPRSTGADKAFLGQIGCHSAADLGYNDGRIPTERYEPAVRRALTLMNMDLRPGADGPLCDPLLNGTILCRLINHVVVPRTTRTAKVSFVECPSYPEACSNFVNALAFLRRREVAAIHEGIPQTFLHVQAESVLRGATDELWGLIYFLLRKHGALPGPEDSNAAPLCAISAKLGVVSRSGEEVYTPRNMAALDAAACEFIFRLNVLAFGPSGPLGDSAPFLSPLEAPHLPPREKCTEPTQPPKSIAHPSVWPYIRNGTLLCDMVSSSLNTEVKTYRNPKVASCCLKNIAAAQFAVKCHVPKVSAQFLCVPDPIFEGDLAFTLFFLEDVMRLVHGAQPRRGKPAPSQSPFIPPTTEKSTVSVQSIRSKAQEGAPDVSLQLKERQPFAPVSLPGAGPAPTTSTRITNTILFKREADGGANGSSIALDTANRSRENYTLACVQPPPNTIRIRAALHATVPSSGRSIVPSDEQSEVLEPEKEPSPLATALLPRHIEYISKVKVSSDDAQQIVDWLISKLGPHYHYSCALFSFSSEEFVLEDPCLIFCDGVLLAELVSILMYRKCPALDNIQKNPKTAAARKRNIKKVIDFLVSEKKILVNAIFLDEALMIGDVRAVVLMLQELRRAFHNHGGGGSAGGVRRSVSPQQQS